VGTGLVVAGRGSRSGKVAAGAIGGVLGGVAGYSLTSSEIKKLRGMIKAMFQGLPAR
jgi:outer membrane lipoprotein SlyB